MLSKYITSDFLQALVDNHEELNINLELFHQVVFAFASIIIKAQYGRESIKLVYYEKNDVELQAYLRTKPPLPVQEESEEEEEPKRV